MHSSSTLSQEIAEERKNCLRAAKPSKNHGTASVQWQVRWTHLERGRIWWDIVEFTISMEKMKGSYLQIFFFHEAGVGRHQIKHPSVKHQARGRGKDVLCPGSTSLSGEGAFIQQRNLGCWLTVQRHFVTTQRHKVTFLQEPQEFFLAGPCPTEWHKECYLKKQSRMLKQTGFNDPREGWSCPHPMGPAKQSTLISLRQV